MQTKTVLTKVARTVKNRRQEKHHSIAKLASLRSCGVSETTIRRIEKAGQTMYNPKLDTLVKLANGLNISVNDLVGQLRGQ